MSSATSAVPQRTSTVEVRQRALIQRQAAVLQSVIDFGLVWLPEHAIVRVAHDCEITEVLSIPGTTVFPDISLLQCNDAELDNRLSTIGTTVQELCAERAGWRSTHSRT